MKILVTGAAGFIGYHVAELLLARGNEVAGLDDLNAYYNPALKQARLDRLARHAAFRFEKINLADRAAMERLFQKNRFDAVVHLGGQAGVRHSLSDPHIYVDANLVGFLHVLEGCRQGGVGHLVYAGSSSVYGLNQSMPWAVGDNVDHPVSLYAATKKANELMAHSYSHLYQLPTTGLRFFTVYGPWGRPDMAPMLFSRALLAGKPIKLFNHGKMRRSFTYINDVVEGVVRIAAQPAQPNPSWTGLTPDPATSSAPYRVHNIGHSEEVELLDFVRLLEELWGVKARMEMLPMQPGDVLCTAADTRSLEEAVGYRPKVGLREGLARFVDWYRENREICERE